jgi:hypothetical protein
MARLAPENAQFITDFKNSISPAKCGQTSENQNIAV